MPGSRRVRRPGQLDAGPFEADIASFRLHLASENKAAGTIRIYANAVRWFAASLLLGETVAAADPWNPEDPPVYVRQPGDRPWEPFATRMSLACAEMVLSEVLLGAESTAMCDLSGVLAIAAAESAYERIALPEYPLWYVVTSRWFAAPGKHCCAWTGGGPSCWLVAAGQTHNDLQSVCTPIPGGGKGFSYPRRRSAFPSDRACHARADDLCSPLRDRGCALRRTLGVVVVW